MFYLLLAQICLKVWALKEIGFYILTFWRDLKWEDPKNLTSQYHLGVDWLSSILLQDANAEIER